MISILKLFCRFSVTPLLPTRHIPRVFCVVFISLSFQVLHKFMYTQIMHFRIYLLTREFTFSVIACQRVLSEKWEKERREEKKHGITSKYARGRVHGEISLSVEDGRERISGRRKFGNLLSETRLIPLEFLIKDRCALAGREGQE